MTAVSASLLIKALIVTTGYTERHFKPLGDRGLTVELNDGQSVVIMGNAGGFKMDKANKRANAAAGPIAEHYRDWLNGGAMPNAPAGVPTMHHYETAHEGGRDGGWVETLELAETQETKRVAALRNILKEGQCKVVEGKLVDTFSASAFIQVYDAVNEANKAKLLSFSLAGAIGCCFKLINNQGKK